MNCNQCQNEMVKDCNVNVEYDTPGIRISKKSGRDFTIMYLQNQKQPFVQIVVM
ncbi:hypothetical protein [Paenisporosarcina antarctica]|uniref:hypothetical protein n=1 Tax=Paenisporosarcina antarctica TaxID=417367 RepID=UPI001416FA87|nr:hypothetical protein [Paenisporosarcina antarctica]